MAFLSGLGPFVGSTKHPPWGTSWASLSGVKVPNRRQTRGMVRSGRRVYNPVKGPHALVTMSLLLSWANPGFLTWLLLEVEEVPSLEQGVQIHSNKGPEVS